MWQTRSQKVRYYFNFGRINTILQSKQKQKFSQTVIAYREGCGKVK